MKSNGTYFFVVETENFVGTASLFEENLKRTFPSAEFMRGYAEGYGFGKIDIYTPQDLEKRNNNPHRTPLGSAYIYAVNVQQAETDL